MACARRINEAATTHTLQVCLDSGAKKVLIRLPAIDWGDYYLDMIGHFNIIFYQVQKMLCLSRWGLSN